MECSDEEQDVLAEDINFNMRLDVRVVPHRSVAGLSRVRDSIVVTTASTDVGEVDVDAGEEGKLFGD